jgi:glycosyltransferase involved in cell wall biosynthesis
MKISIITICRNSQNTIEETIKSVINQSIQNQIEYIIIDGSSTDRTIDIIKKYQKSYSIDLVSEPDAGIYDAMNKGIDLATGEYLNFMNSGDYFFSNKSVEKILPYLNTENKIVYGDTEIRYSNFKKIKKEPNPNKLWMGRTPHQSAFIEKKIMKQYKYNTSNKLVADFEFFLQVYYSGGKIKKIPFIISSFAKDGISEKKSMQVIKDAHRTVKKFKKGLLVDIYYNLLKIKPLIKRVSNEKFFKFLKTGKII